MRFFQKLAKMLLNGGVAVIPTDTLYGIVGSALAPKTVERIYRLRKRNKKKPMIVLIHSFKDLGQFGVRVSDEQQKMLARFWPGKVSVVFPVQKSFVVSTHYLHRGIESIAFRMPALKPLAKLLMETGPLVAPSANIEGMPPALTIKDAVQYFGDGVDCYVDGGKRVSKPSTLVRFERERLEILREGAVKIPKVKN